MCGRLACTLNPQHLQEACSYLNENLMWVKPQWIPSKYTYKPFYNGPPTTILPVLAHKGNFAACHTSVNTEYVLVPMRWSMTPKWHSSTKTTFHTHNARVETLLTSQLFKDSAIEGRRCVIIADGYYEWQTTGGSTKRQPYFLYKQPGGRNGSEETMEWNAFNGWTGKYVMKLAGIFNCVKEAEGFSCSCSVITAEANTDLSWLHHRMPVLCDFDYHIQKWLTKPYLNTNDIMPYLYKLCNLESPDQLSLKFHPVNPTYINNSSYDHPKCMEADGTNKSKSTLDNWFGKRTKESDSQ